MTEMARGIDAAPMGELVDERTMVNACVALLASGGSTNHTMHLVAMARADSAAGGDRQEGSRGLGSPGPLLWRPGAGHRVDLDRDLKCPCVAV